MIAAEQRRLSAPVPSLPAARAATHACPSSGSSSSWPRHLRTSSTARPCARHGRPPASNLPQCVRIRFIRTSSRNVCQIGHVVLFFGVTRDFIINLHTKITAYSTQLCGILIRILLLAVRKPPALRGLARSSEYNQAKSETRQCQYHDPTAGTTTAPTAKEFGITMPIPDLLFLEDRTK